MARTAKRYKKNTEKKVLGIPVCMAAIYARLSVDSDEKKSECSDGVSDMVSIEFLETMLLQTQSPAKCVDTILAAALEAGGKDNITVIVLEINR